MGPRFRAFDVWIGGRNGMAHGPRVGTNTITREPGDSALHGRRGTNARWDPWAHGVNRGDPAAGRWRRLWVDMIGTQADDDGAARDARIRFTGAATRPGRDAMASGGMAAPSSRMKVGD